MTTTLGRKGTGKKSNCCFGAPFHNFYTIIYQHCVLCVEFFFSSNVCATVHFLFSCLIPSCPGEFIYFLGRERVFFGSGFLYNCFTHERKLLYNKVGSWPQKKKKIKKVLEKKKKEFSFFKEYMKIKKNQSQIFSFAFLLII